MLRSEGVRLTPAHVANAALEQGVHIVGLSILSGSHMPLGKEVLRRMRDLKLKGQELKGQKS